MILELVLTHWGEPQSLIQMPRPFSTNGMKAGRSRWHNTAEYKRWVSEAQTMMIGQGPRPSHPGPVAVICEFPTMGVSTRFDTDNGLKACLDVLTSMHVLPDDNRMVVRDVAACWSGDFSHTWVYIWDLKGTA